MTHAIDLTAILKLCFWEISLGALCLCPLLRIRDWRQRLALFLSLDITVASLLASAASFLQINSPATYLIAATVMLLGAAVAARKGRPAIEPRSVTPPTRRTLLHLALVAIFVPVVVLSFSPIREPDSLFNLHFVFGWLENLTTPYAFAFHYVPFWELSYLPVLCLTGNDIYFWLQSVKPIVLLGSVLLLVAEELALPASLAHVSVAASLLFPNLWFHLSGLATLKNDMLAAAGQAILGLTAIRALRGRLSLPDWSLLALALCFVSAKYSGPVLIVAGLLVASPWLWRYARNDPKWFPIVASSAALFLISVGHYYLHNFVVYGNPLYPFQINLGPLHLPGLGDLSNTSILYNLGEPLVWRSFFWPSKGLSPAGALFPFVFAAMFLVSGLYCGKAIVARLRGVAWQSVNVVVSVYLLVVLAVYLRSVYGASGNPGDLAFVRNDLNSVRYITGGLLVAEVFFVSLMVQFRWPSPVILVLILVQGFSRVAILIEKWIQLPTAAPGPIIVWTVLLVCIASAAILLRGWRWKAMSLVATFAVLLVASNGLLEDQRSKWLPHWGALFQPLYRGAPQDTFLIVDDEYSEQGCAHLPLRGYKLKNRVRTGSLQELLALLKQDASPPAHVVWIKRSAGAEPNVLDARYAKAAEVPAGILYSLRQ